MRWLAASRQGRVAFLTNVLELHTLPEAKTKGDLPIRFLESNKSPREFADELAKEANQYNGFNLIVADFVSKFMVYVSNRPKGEPVSIQEVCLGIHVLSNATLNSPWPKVIEHHISYIFQIFFHFYGQEEIPLTKMVGKLMRDTVKADKGKLPNICSPHWELGLSSIFVEVDSQSSMADFYTFITGKYGTRSTAVLTVKACGEASFYEVYLEGGQWEDHTLDYHIEKL
ncbi:Protein of unknown function (DUF833 [Striga hermonthica]|uniref:Uncharacterized protein n=1 Tax=Striga hermonthica TaxID=68872 RepID=A0A9N7NZ27_STRHE|nr:Protein of unknown function (DUF833 [Striga hermonthica]